MRECQPDVIVHQLTALPKALNLRKFDRDFAQTNRLRIHGTDNLLAGARTVGCKRIVAQSYAGWPYEQKGGMVKTEDDPLSSDPAPAQRESLRAIRHLESSVLNQPDVEGFVLRYGGFYGPGTSLGIGGSALDQVKRRQVPLVGKATGYWSFLHIDDAASATLAAIESTSPGVYNIVDDHPAPVSVWLPYLAGALGAPPPRHIPSWLARLAIGEQGVAMMTSVRGASNQKARSLLSWTPKWRSWREGFVHGLVDSSQTASLIPGRDVA